MQSYFFTVPSSPAAAWPGPSGPPPAARGRRFDTASRSPSAGTRSIVSRWLGEDEPLVPGTNHFFALGDVLREAPRQGK